jgi:hypothetical protein
MPGNVRPQLPGDIHAAILAEHDTAVFERRHRRRKQRNDIHFLVGRGQPLDNAGLDVFEDVRAEAVQRIRFAVVADNQQLVRRLVAARVVRGTPQRNQRHHGCAEAGGGSQVFHGHSWATSGTGIEPNDSTRS